ARPACPAGAGVRGDVARGRVADFAGRSAVVVVLRMPGGIALLRVALAVQARAGRADAGSGAAVLPPEVVPGRVLFRDAGARGRARPRAGIRSSASSGKPQSSQQDLRSSMRRLLLLCLIGCATAEPTVTPQPQTKLEPSPRVAPAFDPKAFAAV